MQRIAADEVASIAVKPFGKPRKRLHDPLLVAEIINAYRHGVSATRILNTYRLNHITLKAILTKAGVKLRPKGWRPTTYEKRLSIPGQTEDPTYRTDYNGERINVGKTYRELLEIAARRGSKAAQRELGAKDDSE